MSSSTHDSCFDEATLAAMIVAYDQACRSLQFSGLTPIVREMIGKRIIEAAKQGERDPKILHQQALKTLQHRGSGKRTRSVGLLPVALGAMRARVGNMCRFRELASGVAKNKEYLL